MLDQDFMNSLLPGTIIEINELVGLFIGDNKIVVLSSDFYEEKSILFLVERGYNDWILTNEVDYHYSNYQGIWISRDWNGKLRSKEYDAYDILDDYDEWDQDLDARLERYDEYDY
jgi:hypothetical protein